MELSTRLNKKISMGPGVLSKKYPRKTSSNLSFSSTKYKS